MSNRDQALLDLLAAKATEGLDPSDQAALDLFCQARAGGISSFERETAALSLAFAAETETMPTHVRTRVAAALRDASSQPITPTDTIADASNVTVGAFGAETTPPARSAVVPWLAAAAALVLAVLGWWPRPEAIDLGPAGPVLTAADRRAVLIDTAPDTVQIAWTATDDPAATGAQGDVVWNTDRQRGFMRISGLAPNDPNEAQYQLWIFDANQDERFPVDGGVFNVDPNGETIVTIDQKIAVDQPTLFAVTVEKPGGVVVSSRERIVLTAQVG